MVDFEGQKLAELIFYVVIIAFGGVGWVVGFLQQDFTIVFQAWLVGVVLSVIVRCQARCEKCRGCPIYLAMLIRGSPPALFLLAPRAPR
jgi:Microsomal signal peptidase 12 kDa subunit (SPC12)